MRPINLLPPEAKSAGRPLRAGALSYVVVALLALALVAVTAVVLIGNDISADKTELASLEAERQVAQQRVEVLAPYTETATLSSARYSTVANLAESRFDWERVLQELAIVIPPDVWLTGISAAVSPEVSTEGGVTTEGIVGPALSFTGCGASQESVARLVAALKDIDGVTRVGLEDSSLPDGNSTVAADDAEAESGTAAPPDASDTDCQTKSFIAGFAIVATFDAVTVQAPAPLPPATSEADDGGVNATTAQQQDAVDSTDQKIEKANNVRSAVELGG